MSEKSTKMLAQWEKHGRVFSSWGSVEYVKEFYQLLSVRDRRNLVAIQAKKGLLHYDGRLYENGDAAIEGKRSFTEAEKRIVRMIRMKIMIDQADKILPPFPHLAAINQLSDSQLHFIDDFRLDENGKFRVEKAIDQVLKIQQYNWSDKNLDFDQISLDPKVISLFKQRFRIDREIFALDHQAIMNYHLESLNNSNFFCFQCKTNLSESDHLCPRKEDIEGKNHFCNCCKQCTQECKLSI